MATVPGMALNVLLGLVCVGFGLFVWSAGARWGPEGPVGALVIPIPFLLILLGVLVACVRRGSLDWAPGGVAGASLLVIGLMAGVGAALFLSFEQDRTWWQWLLAAAPFAVVAGCGFVVNGSPALVVRGGLMVAALGGWGYLLYVVTPGWKVQQRDDETGRAAADLLRYQALSTEASLAQLLPFVYSPNEGVLNGVRGRIAGRPGLDGELIELLQKGVPDTDAEWALSYVANVHNAPGARLAEAYAHVLETGLRYWDRRLSLDEHAEKSEPELRVYFVGAEGIQQGGGDLRPQLRLWHERLKQVKGLGGLADYVKSIADAGPRH